MQRNSFGKTGDADHLAGRGVGPLDTAGVRDPRASQAAAANPARSGTVLVYSELGVFGGGAAG